jgi:endoglucanase
MRSSICIFVLTTLLCLTLDARSGVADESRIVNGGFEADVDRDSWPDGWGKLKSGGSWEVEDGNHFLRLRSSRPGETVLLYHRLGVVRDVRAVELSWRWRVQGLKAGKQSYHDARVMIGLLDGDGKKLPGGPGAAFVRKDTEGWAERSVRFLIPEEAAAIEIMPALLEVAAGSLDLDELSLSSVDPAPLEAEARAAALAKAEKQARDAAARSVKAAKRLAETGTLVTNGDFEADKKGDGKPDDWGLPKSGSWEVEDGNHFVRLSATEPGQMVMLYRLIDLPADVGAVELTWRERIHDLKTGERPWFDARIMMHFQDAAGKQMPGSPPAPSTRKDTDGWRERKTQFLVPKGAVTLEFMPALFEVRKGILDLDDIALKPTDPAPLLAAAAKKAEDDRLANVPVEAPRRESWPKELHVEGNKVLTSDGKPIVLQGVNVVSLEFLLRGDHVLKSCQVAVDNWKANLIRLPVKESYWFGREPEQTDGGESYRKLVDDAITMVANRGAYVLLDLHRFRAPKAEHAEFWTAAATKYKDHPAVLFDLFNEPHGVSWEVWRDGGFVAEKEKPADEDTFLTPEEKSKNSQGFESVGMQKLIDAVRATGAKNIVVAGGLDWAYDLSGVAEGYELDDRGGRGLIYSTHIYPWKFHWKEKVLVTAAKHPILVGEVGADVKKMDFIPAENQEDPYTWVPDMLGFMQQHGLHWTAFSFHPSATPVMIKGWDYTPTPFWGEFVKRALAGEQFPRDKAR